MRFYVVFAVYAVYSKNCTFFKSTNLDKVEIIIGIWSKIYFHNMYAVLFVIV